MRMLQLELALNDFDIDDVPSVGRAVAWFDSSTYLVTRDCPQARFFADVSGVDMIIDANPQASGIKPTGIDILSSDELASQVHAEIEAIYGSDLSLLDFPSVTAIHNASASKGNALAEMARELSIPQHEVLAIGDSVNDVSMLQWAGQSASPAHGDNHARRATKEVLPGDGVSGVVTRLQAIIS